MFQQESLDVSTGYGKHGFRNSSFLLVSRHCCTLRRVYLHLDHLHDGGVISLLAAGCPKLQILKYGLVDEAMGISGHTIEALAISCPDLECVSLPPCNLELEGLSAFGRHCQKLKSLTLHQLPARLLSELTLAVP
jgi:hypothetical protein